MGNIVWMRGPDGSRMPFDSEADSASIRQAHQAGATVDTVIASGTASHADTMRVIERQLKDRTNSPQARSQRRQFQKHAIPLAAGALTTAVVPGSAPLAWALRPGAAALGAGAAAPLGQMQAGERPTAAFARNKALEAGGGQLFGEGLAGGAKLAARGLATRTFASAPKKDFIENIANESRIAGEKLAPGDAGLGDAMLREGVAPGKMPGQKQAGSQVLDARLKEAAAKRDAVLSSPGVAGKKFTTMGLVGNNVSALRADIARLGDPRLMAWFDKRIRDFHRSFRVKLPGGRLGKARQLSPLEVQKELISTWDDVARNLHGAESGVQAPKSPRALMEERFLKAMADDARVRLRALTPDGAVERANQEIYRLMPLHDATVDLEIPRWHNDMALTSTTAGLGAFGGAMGGGGVGALEGSAGGALFGHLLSQPAVSGRAALTLNNPWTQEMLRRAPIPADVLARYGMTRTNNQ